MALIYAYRIRRDDVGQRQVDLFLAERELADIPAGYVRCDRATLMRAWRLRDYLDLKRLWPKRPLVCP